MKPNLCALILCAVALIARPLCTDANQNASASSGSQRDVVMWLCRSPLIAYDFWNDLGRIQSLGIRVDYSIAAQVAKHEQNSPCTRVSSSRLKPVSSGWGDTLALADGGTVGWATTAYYIMYNKNHGADFELEAAERQRTSRGMWLCSSSRSAFDFWQSIKDAYHLGVDTRVYSIGDQIATGKGCFRVNSDHLEIAKSQTDVLGQGVVYLSDGQSGGWAEAEYYVGYERPYDQ